MSTLELARSALTATVRWSTDAQIYKRGTLWYGMMCKACLSMDSILESCLGTLLPLAGKNATVAAKKRASSKAVSDMTMGQRIAVLEEVAPELERQLQERFGFLKSKKLLPSNDREHWRAILARRNHLVHRGPGFVDSQDLAAGRHWPTYEVEEPLEIQATMMWEVVHSLAQSNAVLTAVVLEGVSHADAIAVLAARVNSPNYHEATLTALKAIKALHEETNSG